MEDIHPDTLSLIFCHLPVNTVCSLPLVSSYFSWLTTKDKLLPLLQHGIPNREISTLTITQAVYLCRHPHTPRRIVISSQFVWLLRRGELCALSVMGFYPGMRRSCPSLSNIVEFALDMGLYVLDSDGKLYSVNGDTINQVDIVCPVVQIFGQERQIVFALDSRGCIRVGPSFSVVVPGLPYISSVVDRQIGVDKLLWFVDVNGRYWSYNIEFKTIQLGGVPDPREETIVTYMGEVAGVSRYEHHALHKDGDNDLWVISKESRYLLISNVEEYYTSGKYLGVITSSGTYLVNYLPARGDPKPIRDFVPKKIC